MLRGFSEDGSKKSFTMDGKRSGDIFTEVMDAAGTPAWDKWKAERIAANLPIVDDPPEGFARKSQNTRKTGASAVLP